MAKKQTGKAAASGYAKGSTGYDAKGNRVSANSPSAVSVGTVRGGVEGSTKGVGAGPIVGGKKTSPGFGQAKENVTGYEPPIDYTVSDNAEITAKNRAKAFQNAARRSTVVATSEQARDAVTTATGYLDAQAQRKAQQRAQREEQQRQKDLAASAPGATPEVPGAAGTSLADTMSAVTGDMQGEEARARIATNAAQAEAAAADYQRVLTQYGKKIDNLTRDMDDRTAEIVRSINDEYAGLMEEQRAANRAYEAGVTTAGLTSGRSRYAPEIQGGIAKEAVDQGIGKLEGIQQKRARLVLEAESARDEQRWKELSTKMDLVRESYKEERDTARQVQQDVRDAIKFERESYEYVAASLAPTLATALTGNRDEDDALILQAAQEQGIPVTVLAGAVENQRRQNEQSLPEIIRELNMAKAEGWVPQSMTPNQYRAAQAAATRAPKDPTSDVKTLTLQDAAKIGLRELVGVPLEEITLGSTDSTGAWLEEPPTWFRDLQEAREGRTLTSDEYVQKLWDKQKRREPFKEAVYTGKVSAGVSALTGRAYGLPSDTATNSAGSSGAPVEGFSGSIPGLN